MSQPDVSAGQILATFRAQHGQLETRRASLAGEMEVLDRQLSGLRDTISRLEDAIRSLALPGPAKTDSLAARLVDTIEATGSRRRDLLRVLRPEGFKDAAIDSALTRLKDRGVIRREGALVFRVEPPSEADPASKLIDPSRPSAVVAGGTPVSVDSASPEPVSAPVSAGSSGSAPVGGAADHRTMRERVREVVATSGATTRQNLVAHFEAQGVRASSVDAAVAGLCKSGVLRRGSVGAVALVSDPDTSSGRDAERDAAGSG